MLEMTMTDSPWWQRLADMRQSIQPIDTIPQELADGWTEIMSVAVRAFHEPDFVMIPAPDFVDNLSDEEVHQRITGYQEGYDKEYRRLQGGEGWGISISFGDTKRYVFEELPREVQRAVVSHWDRLHHEWLAARPAEYNHQIGYHWVIEGVVIPYLDVDCGEVPESADLMRLGGTKVVEGPHGGQLDIGVDYDL